MSEARTTNWARGRQVHRALIALRSGDSFLPGQGVISGLGARGSRRACYLGNFSLDSESWESDYFCHDVKRQKIMQLTGKTNKKQRVTKNRSGRLQTWKWFCWNPLWFCWKWLILLKPITIRVLTNQNISKILLVLFFTLIIYTSFVWKRVREIRE